MVSKNFSVCLIPNMTQIFSGLAEQNGLKCMKLLQWVSVDQHLRIRQKYAHFCLVFVLFFIIFESKSCKNVQRMWKSRFQTAFGVRSIQTQVVIYNIRILIANLVGVFFVYVAGLRFIVLIVHIVHSSPLNQIRFPSIHPTTRYDPFIFYPSFHIVYFNLLLSAALTPKAGQNFFFAVYRLFSCSTERDSKLGPSGISVFNGLSCTKGITFKIRGCSPC